MNKAKDSILEVTLTGRNIREGQINQLLSMLDDVFELEGYGQVILIQHHAKK